MAIIPILHILIVDDNPVCSAILCRMLVSEQLKAITTLEITVHCSPEHALPDLKKTKYDIIFTDIEMMKMSGCDMAKTIRDKSVDAYIKNRDTTIVAITSKYDSKSLIEYKEAGITDCLKKPVQIDSIYAIIKDRAAQ